MKKTIKSALIPALIQICFKYILKPIMNYCYCLEIHNVETKGTDMERTNYIYIYIYIYIYCMCVCVCVCVCADTSVPENNVSK